jgi:hypothetical protein
MEWLEPWWSISECDDAFHRTFEAQLRLEICPDDPIFGIPAKVIGRGNGDDALFQLLDGSGRVAFVHLKWGTGRELGKFRTQSIVYENLDVFVKHVMQPEHADLISHDR